MNYHNNSIQQNTNSYNQGVISVSNSMDKADFVSNNYVRISGFYFEGFVGYNHNKSSGIGEYYRNYHGTKQSNVNNTQAIQQRTDKDEEAANVLADIICGV
mmetsp:Transcript_8240/g.16954  ORF Transcript_8240/g.16954 Transcript_8240/m.16954 type:complete len:101 (+) Transcript_8240:549-851(+)